MGCSFCATGTMKLTRSLTAGEIVSQVYAAQAFMSNLEEGSRQLSHLVFMGMGEPLHCYESTRDAVRILIDQRGRSLAARKITVSTVGLIPAIQGSLGISKVKCRSRYHCMPVQIRYETKSFRSQKNGASPTSKGRSWLTLYLVKASLCSSMSFCLA